MRILTLLLLPILLTAQSPLVPAYSISGDTLMTLSHKWTMMGDTNGIFDTPTDDVSVENGQFSHDKTVISSVSKGDYTVRLFDAETGAELWQADGRQETECSAFTQDDEYLVTGGEAAPEITIWSTSDGSMIRTLAGLGHSVEGMVFSPDFSLLACGTEAGRVEVYDTSDPDPRNWPDTALYSMRHGPDRDVTGRAADDHSDINQLEWSSDGEFLFSGSRNGEVKRWKREFFGFELNRTYRAGARGSIKSVDLSEEEDLVVSSSRIDPGRGAVMKVVAHDVETGEIVFEYQNPAARTPENVTFDPSGQLLLVATSMEGVEEDDARTFIWTTADVRAGRTEPRQTITWFEQEYLDFSDAADRLIVSGNDGSLRVFDVTVDTSSVTTSLPFTAVPEVQALTVYPNPSLGGTVRLAGVAFRQGHPVEVIIYDAVGRRRNSHRLYASEKGVLELALPADLPRGTWHLRARQDDVVAGCVLLHE